MKLPHQEYFRNFKNYTKQTMNSKQYLEREGSKCFAPGVERACFATDLSVAFSLPK